MPTIALIAHDGKKADMIAFALQQRDLIRPFDLVATGTTGRLIEEKVGLPVHRYLSGPLGGDVQIAERVIQGEIQAVFFFVDPLDKHPHDPDIQTLLRACNVHNVPLATNAATAELILSSQRVRNADFEAREDADARAGSNLHGATDPHGDAEGPSGFAPMNEAVDAAPHGAPNVPMHLPSSGNPRIKAR